MVTAALVGALNLALNTQGKISELVKQSKDTALKEQINTLYDHLLQVKSLAADLVREDESLREQLRVRTTRRDEKFGYVYLEGETDPLCQKCFYESNGTKVVYLSPVQKNDTGHVWRRCPVCNHSYVEQQGEPEVIGPSRSRWMDGYSR